MIDLRSDTVTMPTERMRELMAAAEVGDDVYRDDPTVARLEELAAELVGKEAALFVPSGTMGNQLCIMTHTKRGEEIIVHEKAHVVFHEAGAIGLLSQCNIAAVHHDKDFVYDTDIIQKVRGNNIHYPKTSLVCIENALGNGTVIPLADMRQTYRQAKDLGLSVHLDGARIFNAAAYLQVDAKELATNCDSVMFCLSKGLCAPVGSMIAGTKEFIDRARHNRKLMGGGMRQAGILAAAGIEALTVMTKRLREDHEHARYLATELAKFPNITVDLDQVQINMVFFTVHGKYEDEDFVSYLRKYGIKINGMEDGKLRFVTHHGITREHIEEVILRMKTYFE